MEPRTSINGRSRILAATASALVAAALLPGMIAPATASAAQETRTYTWGAHDPQPSIPQTITGSNGQEMTLTSQTSPRQAGASQTLTQYFTQNRDMTIGADQLGNLQNIVPATLHIDSDGYVGDIPRVGNINYWPVNRAENDHREENKTIQVTDANATPPDTMLISGYNYSLKSYTRSDGMKDSTGRVLSWNLNCVYQYDRSYEVLDHYNVSASYAGNITKQANSGDWTMSVVYTSPDPAPAQPEQNNNDQNNGDQNAVVPVDQPADPNANPDENANQNANSEMPPESLNSGNIVNPFENNSSNRNSNGSGSNGNSETGDDEGTGSTTEDEEQGIPWPLIIGCGVGALALIGILAFVLGRRKKNKDKAEAVDPVMMAAAGAGVAAGAAGAGMAAGAAGAAGGAAVAGALMEEEPACQLIAVLSTPEGFDQDPKANLTLDVSGDKDIPSVIKFPSLVDEYAGRMYFEPEDNASYWIAIDGAAVDAAVSDKVIVATDDGQEIYRGAMETQFQLDTDVLAGSLNDTIPADERKDISEELARYAAVTDVPATAEAVYAAADDEFNFDDDFGDDDYSPYGGAGVDTDAVVAGDDDGFPGFDDDIAAVPEPAIADTVADDFNDFADDFDDFTDDFSDSVKEKVHSAADAVKEAASDAGEVVSGTIGGFEDDLEDLAGGVKDDFDDIKDDFDDDLDDFRDMLDDIK